MGYTTKFSGQINLSRPLTMAEARDLLTYNEEPEKIPNPPVQGGYMQWVPSRTLKAIGWDGNQTFYDYEAWLTWVCAWLKERGIGTAGQLLWSGEQPDDTGELLVVDGEVTVLKGKTATMRFVPLTLDALAKIALDQVASA